MIDKPNILQNVENIITGIVIDIMNLPIFYNWTESVTSVRISLMIWPTHFHVIGSGSLPSIAWNKRPVSIVAPHRRR